MSTILVGALVFLLLAAFLLAFGFLLTKRLGANLWDKLREFLWLSAGAAPEVLRKCSAIEQVKYSCLGMAMLLISILAASGMTLVVSEITGAIFPAIVAGCFWGFIVYTADRLLVMSIDKFERGLIKGLKAAPRVLLTVCLSILISDSILNQLFHSELEAKIKQIAGEKISRIQEQIKARYPEMILREERLGQINQQIKDNEEKIASLREQKRKELSGEGATKIPGRGHFYAAISEEQNEVENTLAQLRNEQKAIEAELVPFQQKVDEELKGHSQAQMKVNGVLARTRALYELCLENKAAGLMCLVTLAACMLIELIPLTSKTLSSPDGYDLELRKIKRQREQEDHFQEKRAEYEERVFDQCLSKGSASQLEPELRPLAEEIRNQLHHNLKERLSAAGQRAAATEHQSALSSVKVYLSEPTLPDRRDEQRSLTINFTGAEDRVLGRDLYQGLDQVVKDQEFQHAFQLKPGNFKVVNQQNADIEADKALFAQLGAGRVAFLYPAYVN